MQETTKTPVTPRSEPAERSQDVNRVHTTETPEEKKVDHVADTGARRAQETIQQFDEQHDIFTK